MDIEQFFNYVEETRANSALNLKDVLKSVVVQNPYNKPWET